MKFTTIIDGIKTLGLIGILTVDFLIEIVLFPLLL